MRTGFIVSLGLHDTVFQPSPIGARWSKYPCSRRRKPWRKQVLKAKTCCFIMSMPQRPFGVRKLIKKPWVFIGVPYMNPTVLGLQGQGFLIRLLHFHMGQDSTLNTLISIYVGTWPPSKFHSRRNACSQGVAIVKWTATNYHQESVSTAYLEDHGTQQIGLIRSKATTQV